MDNALTHICQQIDDLVCSVSNAGLFHGSFVVAKTVYDVLETLRYVAAREFHCILYLSASGDRHDTRDDRNGDSGFFSRGTPGLKKILLSKNIWVGEIFASGFNFSFLNLQGHLLWSERSGRTSG